MRVITGTARGRKLTTPEGSEIRPTTDRVKEGIFSSIQFQIEGRRVLDLFAGSGQMGVEALSRGAESAIFIDSSSAAIQVIKNNLDKTGLSENARVIQMDYQAFLLTTSQTFDVAFVDPPYRQGILHETLPLLAEKMSEGGVIVCECPEEEQLPDQAGEMMLDRVYEYGNVKVATYRTTPIEESKG